MDRETWLEWRKQGIGASDATIIMGKAPRTWEINSPYKLWLHKMGKLETIETAAMRMGHEFEGEALNWFENRLETFMFSQEVFTHPHGS